MKKTINFTKRVEFSWFEHCRKNLEHKSPKYTTQVKCFLEILVQNSLIEYLSLASSYSGKSETSLCLRVGKVGK